MCLSFPLLSIVLLTIAVGKFVLIHELTVPGLQFNFPVNSILNCSSNFSDIAIDRKNVPIAIIGAGFSGLSAYNRLQDLGFRNVQIFEASHRIGGRVFPVEIDGIFLQHGAEFINGKGNKIYEIAEDLGLVIGEVEDDHLIFDGAIQSGMCAISEQVWNGFRSFASTLERKYLKMASNPLNWNLTIGELYLNDYNHFLMNCESSVDHRSQDAYHALFSLYKSYYEGEWAAPIERLAFKNYAKWNDKSEQISFSSFKLNSHGYQKVLNHLIAGVQADHLHLNVRITKIDYSGRSVVLSTANKRWEKPFDYVIVTVPIGHLKKFGESIFTPELPYLKRQAIKAIGFGVIQKIFLLYERPFWETNLTSLITMRCDQKGPKSLHNLHTFQPHPWHKYVLVGWLSGNGPSEVNRIEDDELTELITLNFRQAMPGINISSPLKIIRTKWLDDELYHGSYSYITPEAVGLPIDVFSLLASPVYHQKRPKLLFAGEATHNYMYQTTIGAYSSGVREAERIENYFQLFGKYNMKAKCDTNT